MIKNFVKRSAVSLALILGVSSVLAEDIDIFSLNTAVTADAPNILILLDSTSNWSTQFSYEMAALKAVFNSLGSLPSINIGIMMQTQGASDGGYMRFGVRNVGGAAGLTNRDALEQIINEIVTHGGTGPPEAANNATYSQVYNEAYLYLKGLPPRVGINDAKRDCGTSNSAVDQNPITSALGSGYAYSSCGTSGVTYVSPISSSTCQKTFIIYLSNGPIDNSDNGPGLALLNAVGGDNSVIPVTPDGETASNYADEWSRFMKKSMDVVSYAINVNPGTTGQGPAHTAMMKSIAKVGGGRYCESTSQAGVEACLSTFFNEILAINSVFASTTLPLSADNSGAYLNQLYVGMFRPDGQSKPRWYGNLKQYKFSFDSATNSLSVVDSAGTAAASASTGFAVPDAVSFWTSKTTTAAPDATAAASTSATTGSTGGFWTFDAKGTAGSYDSPDGEWVEKGGAAQQLRLAHLGYGSGTPSKGGIGDTNASTLNSLPARKVYTCTGACLTGTGTANQVLADTSHTLTRFDGGNTNITDALLGSITASVSAIAASAAKAITALSAGTSFTVVSMDKTTDIVTTSSNHSFVVGDTINIAGNSSNPNNGSYVIASVPSSTQIGFAIGNNGTGGTATKPTTTATVTAAAHGFVAGEVITIAGVTPSEFNQTCTVALIIDAGQFTCTLSTAVGAVATAFGTARSSKVTATATAHGLNTGDFPTISGATGTNATSYNGTYLVTKVDANSFTYVAAGASAPTANAAGTIVATLGGGRTTLIKWIRGQDTQDENGFKVNGADTDVRASIHGDVLHSRPIVLNYETSSGTTDNLYVFYGGNDGVFRAIKGGQAATDGKEQWAFIPQEFFGNFVRMYNNSPTILYPSTGMETATVKRRVYGFDGPVGSYVERSTTGQITKAIVYIAARRGGRFLYALDVTDPVVPKFLWRISSGDTDFAELGQTWSQPHVVRVLGHTNPVLIFGAGYDAAAEDTEPPSATDTMGRGIFVVDALTGAKVWFAGNSAASPDLAVTGMNFSVAGDVLPVDRNFDGYIDRVYAADVGGNVWRFDVSNSSTSLWAAWKIAGVGDRTTTATSRKFLFGMDAVMGANSDSYDAILLGSGDREHPLSTSAASSVINRVYMFKDTQTGSTGAAMGITDTSAGASAGLFDATSSSEVPADATGWFVTLGGGEKVVNAPVVVGSNVKFGTNKPDTSSTSCTGNLGVARRYSINFLTGAGATFTDSAGLAVRSEVAVGGGFLPSTVTGVVEIGSSKYIFSTDNPLNPGGAEIITITVPTTRFRTYWYQKLD